MHEVPFAVDAVGTWQAGAGFLAAAGSLHSGMMDGSHKQRGKRDIIFCLTESKSLNSYYINTQKTQWDFAYIRKTYYSL